MELYLVHQSVQLLSAFTASPWLGHDVGGGWIVGCEGIAADAASLPDASGHARPSLLSPQPSVSPAFSPATQPQLQPSPQYHPADATHESLTGRASMRASRGGKSPAMPA